MLSGLIGRKAGMTQIFGEKGEVIPVTLIEAGPCVVLQKKASDQEGYDAIQLGYEDIKENGTTNPTIIDDNMRVLVGNQRLLVQKVLGYKFVECLNSFNLRLCKGFPVPFHLCHPSTQ